jgi:outer membrane lipoprotein-sorting protein
LKSAIVICGRAEPASARRTIGAAALPAVIVLALMVFGWPAAGLRGDAAATEPAAPVLSSEEQADIARIEQYFNAVRSMRARFLQVASTGQTAEGTVFLQRPGRMRIEYDAPVPILIVADGTWLIYYDRKLGQVSYLPLGSTPAGILVEDKIRLNGGALTITGFEHEADVIRVSVVRTDSPADGSLTLVFSDNPLQLRQWRVIDAQGITTTVSLADVETGISFEPRLFEFTDPRQKLPAYPE